MAIFVYALSNKNQFTSQSLEAVSYAKHWAEQKNTELITLCINAENPEILSQYGANKIINIKSDNLKYFNAQIIAQVLAKIIDNSIIFPHSPETSAIAGSLSIKKNFPLFTQIKNFPKNSNFEKSIFSGKAKENLNFEDKPFVLTIASHSFGIRKNPIKNQIKTLEVEIQNPFFPISKEEKSEKQDLTTAEIVVCAGRGLQSPENWQIIEDLAEVLGATTACTRPIADLGWRDYNEHAGQTGKIIAPKLYIGIGISGATQHIAGINQSQNIIVINNDSKAELFKYADFGIIGDALEIVPALTKKLRKFKSEKIS